MMKLILFIVFLIGLAVLFCLPMTSEFLDQSPEAFVPHGKPSQTSNKVEPPPSSK
jgi:hypothetical protein